MRKTLLVALITTATAFSLPAFAQVNLGGAAGAAGQVGAGAPAGDALPGAMQNAGHMGNRAGTTLNHAGQKTRHTTHHSMHRAQSATRQNAHANLDANASAQANAAGTHGGADASMHKRAGLSTAGMTGKAGQMGRGVGGQVRGDAHSAIQSSNHTAGSVGKSVKAVKATGNAQGHAHTRSDTDVSTYGH